MVSGYRLRCWRSCVPPRNVSADSWGAFSGFFAGEADRLRRALLGKPPEADHALTPDLQTVAPHERLLAVGTLDEGTVGALVDEHELVAADLDAGMQPR